MKTTLYITLAAISCCVVVGCAHQAVKSDQPAPQSAALKSTAPQAKALIQAKPKPQQAAPQGIAGAQVKDETPMGTVGGKGPVINNATLEAGPQIGKKDYAGTDAGVKEFKADYEKTDDKLAFLLAHVHEPHDLILAQVAGLLGRFDDPKSIAALKKLEQQGGREDLGVSVAQNAQSSLQRLAAAPDLKNIQPDMPATDLEALIIKYGNNDVAHGYIYTAMKQEVDKDPAKYVPLFIEYYADAPLTAELTKKYPDIADKGLETCFSDTNASIVRSCIGLAGNLHDPKYLSQIYKVSYEEKGNIDYSIQSNSAQVRDMALDSFSWNVKAMPYLEKILYGTFNQDKSAAVSLIKTYNTPDSLIMLKKFKAYYVNTLGQDKDLIDQLNRAIYALEGHGK